MTNFTETFQKPGTVIDGKGKLWYNFCVCIFKEGRVHHENHHQKDGLRKSHGAAPPETQTAKKTPHVLAGIDPAADHRGHDGNPIYL